ncbi:tRNA (guanine(9)-N(1))-methyltransferase, partial [Linderina macrospora]
REKARESRKRKRARIAEGEVPVRRRLEDQKTSSVRIVLDMDFDEKMNDKEVKSMCSQVMRCYSVNKQAEKRVSLHISKLHGRGKERFDTAMKDHAKWSADHITFDDCEYIDKFNKEELVYLSADSDNMIETLDPTKVYVVGGIVDKNRYPKLTLEKAEKQGIAHGQLPIGKYIQMSTRKVMTVNQIFEMLVKFVEVEDWKTAFMDSIPQRKFTDDDKAKESAEQPDDESE